MQEKSFLILHFKSAFDYKIFLIVYFLGGKMSLISVNNLSFNYDGSYDYIFKNVSFSIDTDWSLGFTGRNGRGKTTFLNLLLGKYEYTGSIKSSSTFEYFPYEVENKEQNTIDIVEEIYPNYEYWAIKKELSILKVSEDVLYRSFSSLSNGEQTKVLLAALFLKENSFLLIDEPTNHLDNEGRKLLSDYLNTKKGFILVSHDRTFLDKTVDHILSINKANIEVTKGNFSTWYENKQLQDNFEILENEKLKKEVKRLEKTAKEKADWSDKIEATKIGSGAFDRGYIGHKAAKMMKRSKAIEKRHITALDEKSKLLKNIETTAPLKISPLIHHSKLLVSLDNVIINYDEKLVCENVSFKINQGDRIALIGKNGSGKSSIIKLICQENLSYIGEFEKASQLIISQVFQDTKDLSGDLTTFAKENNIDESLFKAILRKLDFSREQFEKDLKDFSGGQKKKVLIAKSLCDKAHLYIWDEPLNFIDVISRMQIENLILEFCPTLLFVEHDEAFVSNIATKKVFL